MKRIFIFITMLAFCSLLLCSCKADKGKNTVKNFVTDFYTVTPKDCKYYEEIGVHGWPKNNQKKNIQVTKDFNSVCNTFKPYLNKQAYSSFYTQSFSYLRAKNAYKKGYSAEVKNLKLTKTEENAKEKSVTYKYTFKLVKTYKAFKKSVSSQEEGYFTVKKENNKWKITNIFDGRILSPL